MKKVLEISKQESPDLVELVEAVHLYLNDIAQVVTCEEGKGRFVSVGAINHSLSVLQKAVEKSSGTWR